jgi:hypothetical protein
MGLLLAEADSQTQLEAVPRIEGLAEGDTLRLSASARPDPSLHQVLKPWKTLNWVHYPKHKLQSQIWKFSLGK